MFVLILLLIGLNGLLAMTELAVVSARRGRLEKLAEEGQTGAARALRLAESPSRFLATVQIGITLVGVLNGALGEDALAEPLAELLAQWAWVAPYAETVSIVAVVLVITYLSLVVGELVPKRLALRWPERAAVLMARPMSWLTVLAAPLVTLLSVSTDTLLRLFGVRPDATETVSEDEIRSLIEQGVRTGTLKAAERDLVRQVFRLDDRAVRAVMTPRHEVVWLDIDASPDAIRRVLAESSHSYYPVADGSLDTVLGLVKAQDILCAAGGVTPQTLREHLRPPLYLPERHSSLEVLDRFRRQQVHLALVVDEFGSVEGLITLHDVVEVIVGELPDQDTPAEPEIVPRGDGSWLVDGQAPAESLKALLEVGALPDETEYTTVGGFVMSVVGTVPSTGERFEWGGHRFEIVDMDGNRIDKVMVTREGGRSEP